MSPFSTVTKLLFGRKRAGDTKGDTKERIVDGMVLSGNEETKQLTADYTNFDKLRT